MIALIGDVHVRLKDLAAVVAALPRRVRTVIQVSDLWAWPEDHPCGHTHQEWRGENVAVLPMLGVAIC